MVADRQGREHQARALLDSGSQSNFITSRMATLLKLPQETNHVAIAGIARATCRATATTRCTISSRYNAYSTTLNFIILERITGQLPVQSITRDAIEVPTNLDLADPEFHKPGRIDMLLGAELFLQWLCLGQFRNEGCQASFQKTVFGWIVSGRVNSETINLDNIQCLTTTHEENLGTQLKRFWQLEEIDKPSTHSTTEARCETIYNQTTQRDTSGWYIVHLPIQTEILNRMGNTRSMAIHRFQLLERRLDQNQDLKEAYCKFMREYESMGHMHLDDKQGTSEVPEVYLPHHGVTRADSSTTKLRVVFDASAKSSTGISLNDTLMTGPTVQDELFMILLRFRRHAYVMTGDLEKIYRQIKVHKPHTQLQRILWREHSDKPLQTFTLSTVTYGTSSAPYLATRTLAQLARDEKERFPRASLILARDFYVDDLLTGADELEDALELQTQLIKLCHRGGFNLRKWCANHAELLSHLPAEAKGTIHQLDTNGNQSIKPLGVNWNPAVDEFHYSSVYYKSNHRCTKRIVISEMTRLFDPLGLIAPVVVKAKIVVQTLWRLQLDWDESLPLELHTTWAAYRRDLQELSAIRVPRRATFRTVSSQSQLHVFCDASEKAYGACIYVQSTDNSGTLGSHLLCAKSRVAPLRAVTIPRLELCAALLAAKLISKTVKAWGDRINSCTMWSDSTIVLAWLKDTRRPNQWKQFVRNRVAEIHELTGNYKWQHVKSEHNPADHVSRGLTVTEIINCPLWWHGPPWIIRPEEEWPPQPAALITDVSEKRRANKTIAMMSTQTENPIPHSELLSRYSRLERLQRITAYSLRFANNCRLKENGRQSKNLTRKELNDALKVWIRQSQTINFNTELEALKRGEQVHSKSRLRTLNPFIDGSGILRIGGRLQHADLSYDNRHPIILKANSNLATLIIDLEHRRLLHAGPQQLLASLRQNYWMINARNAVRKMVHDCLTCHRWKNQVATQLMGSLPATRTTPSPAFHVCGVDYAGPFPVRIGHARSRSTTKAYVALFICFATRAIHIELVSDLTTECFLAALHRFISRRGKPHEINSDNGTTFVGANNQLKQFLQTIENQEVIIRKASQEGINWKFIPPHSPHFGGLWEAGVKATKYHMRRVIGDTRMTFEELYTVVTQIEAVLNSRPLFPMSNDPHDLETVTPGHFLIGRALTSFPDGDYMEVKCLKKRWHMMQQMIQHFWSRWHKEYLLILQHRPKWNTQTPNIEVGTLVLIKEEGQPPFAWSKGRVVPTHPGDDTLIRVVTIKTQNGTIRRPINKLSPLPGSTQNSHKL